VIEGPVGDPKQKDFKRASLGPIKRNPSIQSEIEGMLGL
jgi:hypothetical protein